MKNAINWFEIPTTDLDRATKFYETIFGFKLQVWDMGPMKMRVFPSEDGGVSGALIHGDGSKPSENGSNVYLNADGIIDDVLAKVEANGGKITAPKVLVTDDIGYSATIIDSEGNRVSLHSPKRS